MLEVPVRANILRGVIDEQYVLQILELVLALEEDSQNDWHKRCKKPYDCLQESVPFLLLKSDYKSGLENTERDHQEDHSWVEVCCNSIDKSQRNRIHHRKFIAEYWKQDNKIEEGIIE